MVISEIAADAGIEIVHRCGLVLVPQKSGLILIDKFRQLGVKIVGIERFILHEEEVEPDIGGIADFSAVTTAQQSIIESVRFLRSMDDCEEAYLEFSLDR